MSIVDDLKTARDAIIQRGWYQGWLVDHSGEKICAVGALNLACCGVVNPQTYELLELRNEAHHALTAQLPEGISEVATFNDAPTTTQQDVLDLFEKALANLGGLG